MSSTNRISAALVCLAMTLFSAGCVGPTGHGVHSANGPLSFSNSCGGCGECEGCGELYIDPWINHPADRCDPCDQCGNYNGQSCGKCRSVFTGVASLWGYRCGDTGCNECGASGCDGGCLSHDPSMGCDSCGGAGGSCCGSGLAVGSVVGSEVYQEHGDVVRIVEPTPAKRIVKAGPNSGRYVPHRTRKIFRNRDEAEIGSLESIEY